MAFLAAPSSPVMVADIPAAPAPFMALGGGGLGPTASSIPDYSRSGRECSLLQGKNPTDSLYQEMFGPALHNDAKRFEKEVDERIAVMRGPAAAAGGGVSPKLNGLGYLLPPTPRNAKDYDREAYIIVHYLKTCGRYSHVDAAPKTDTDSFYHDGDYQGAVYRISLTDTLDENEGRFPQDFFFYPNKMISGYPNEFLRIVFNTWLERV
jgi:hypothetical protein